MSDSESERDDPVLEAQLSRTESLRAAAHSFSPAHEFIFVAVVCMAQFMTQAALGACLSPLDIIGESFDVTNPGILSWLIAGYSLTVGTFILFFGRCGDLFGYRLMLLIGFSWFSVWSLVAGMGVYSNYILFIFARTLQGLGPAMLFPNGLAILGATYPPGNKKRLIFALFGGMAPSGAVVGAVFAALLAELSWWPWIFWCMAIYCMLLAVIVYLVVPSTPSHTADMSLTRILEELDIPGAALGVAGLILVNIAWNQAPVVGWQKAYVYVLLIIGFLFLAAFIYYEVAVSPQPLIPFETLNTDVCFILGCVACGWSSFGIWVFYTWRFLEDIRGITPLLAAAQFVPPAPSGLAAAFATAYLMGKLKPGWIMLIALSAFTIGNIFMAINPIGQTYWALTFVSLLVMPWGMDMSFPAATVILSDAVGRRNQGVAASLVTTVVNYSISIGLGIAGTVEVHINNGGLTFDDKLKGYHAAQYTGIGLGGLASSITLTLSSSNISQWVADTHQSTEAGSRDGVVTLPALKRELPPIPSLPTASACSPTSGTPPSSTPSADSAIKSSTLLLHSLWPTR
uniref:Drug resistance protein n=1 Tax=Talaromyces marneffei PM1 TaxID=1077442 RepID=A0A093VT19_TALMA